MYFIKWAQPNNPTIKRSGQTNKKKKRSNDDITLKGNHTKKIK